MSHCHLELVRKLNLFHFVFLNNIKMRLLTLLFLVLDTPCCQKTNTTSKACKIPTPSLCHSSPPPPLGKKCQQSKLISVSYGDCLNKSSQSSVNSSPSVLFLFQHLFMNATKT